MKETNDQVRSAYPDEQKNLNKELIERAELSAKINGLLDLYGYDFQAVMHNGFPIVTMSKTLA